MLNIKDLLDQLTFGQKFLCVASMVGGFTPNKQYPVKYDEEGFLYIQSDFGDRFYCSDDLEENKNITFQFYKPGDIVQKGTVPTFDLNQEKTMTPSKIQETIHRLNGQTPAQAKLTSLRQVSSHVQTVQLDLAHLLLTSESVKELGTGKNCLVKGLSVDANSSVVTLILSVGDVTKEETEAVRVALEELIKPKAE